MSPGRPRDPATGRFISDTRDNSIAIRELNTQLGEAANRFEAMGRSIPTQQINNFDEGLLIGTAALVGLNAALQDVIGSQIDAAVSLERQQVSLQTVTGSVEAAEAQYRRLLEVARLPGINISQALGGSAQLQAIGLSGERAAEAIGAIGNALASSGQSAQQLTPIVSGFRQINAEGKILQEDLAIITTRIPSLIPLMKEAFGGTRAEDVRKFYESIGEADRQTELFSEKLIEMLQTLPELSSTAGNALENLEDTAQRLQARIGTHLLPSVKSAATGLEDVLKAIENSEGATRSIAVFSSFAGTMLSIVTAGASVRGALGLLRPLLPALLGGPWGIAIAAVGALAGVFIAWRAATSEAREEIKNLNTFIAQNTEILKANEAAIESGSLAELRASETTIRKARDAAKARVEQLQESAKAQFDELRGIKRSGEAFDELSGSLRSTSANLKNAEAELERLNTTLKETNTEAGNLEKFETNVNNLKTAIEALNKAAQASEGIGRILRGDGVDSRGPQSDLIKVADAIISDLDTYNQIAEAARGGDERAIENLRTLQTSLRDASQSYLDALRQGLSEAKTVSDFESIIDFADNFEDAFGNVDFLRDLTSEFTALSTAAITALDDFESGLEATQAAIDELERLESLEPSAPLEASEFERRLKAAAQELTARVQAEQAAAKEREQSLRANLQLGEQLDKAATEIFKDQQEEQTDANQDAIDAQQDARKEAAKESEARADRREDREAQRRDDEVRETEKAEKEKTRIAEREARRREREAEREAERIRRRNKQLALDLVGIFESEFDLDFLSEGLQAAFGDPTAFAKSWAEGFLSGIKDILDGAQLSPFQEEIQGLRLSELDTSQLEQALTNNLAQQARLLDGYSETVLQGTVVWESLIASEMALRDQLKAATTSLVDSVAEFQPGFGDQRTPLYNEITQGLVALGLSVEELQPIIGQFADSSLSELRNLNSTIKDRANIDAEQRAEQREEEGRESIADALQSVLPDIADAIDPPDAVPAIREDLEELGLPPDQINAIVTAVEDAPEGVQNAVERLIDAEVQKEAREAEREKKREDRDLKRNASLSSILSLDDASLDVLQKSVRDAEDSPLARLLDNEQGLLRIFGAEQTAAFLVGATHLIREQEEFLRQQRRAQDPEFALVDDLELLLRTAEVESAGAISTPEIDALLTTLRESLALDEGLTSEAAISALTDLRSLLSRANVLAETTDAFTRRFFDEFIQDGLEITVGEIPEAIRVAVDTEGVLLNVDPDAVVGFDAEGALVAVDPTAEVAVEETELPVQETEQPVEEKEQPIDPNAEVPVDTEGKTVDVDTADKTIPIGDLPAGTLIPIEALPPGTVVPIEDLPADVQIQFAGVPEGTLIPIENLPPGTLIPIQALPPELVIPFAGIIEGTVIPFGGVPETESVPFAGVPADTEIGVEDTSEREIAVEDTSDRTITVTIQRPTDTEPEPPAGETPQTLDSVLGLGRGSPTPTPEEVEFLKGLQRPTEGLAGLAGGSAVPSQGEVQLLAELALLREIGEADSQQAVEIKDQLLVGLTSLDSSISEELMTRFPENTAAVQSVTAELMQQIPPVVLSLGTVNASVATGLKNVENSVEKPVDINSLPPVKGEVGVNRLPPVVIQGGEITIRGGSVNIRASETIPVRVENISDLITDIDDTRAQSPAGDFDDPFAG